MRVFHGSKHQLDGGVIMPMQATTYEGSGVPEEELQEAIYTTPELKYALAMAARPDNSSTNIDTERNEITFDNPELFDPEKDIYIYEIETDGLPEGSVNRNKEDKRQITLNVKEGVKPIEIHHMKAKDVMNYYELTNYKKEGENLEPSKDWHPGLRR